MVSIKLIEDAFRFGWHVEVRDPDGKLLWRSAAQSNGRRSAVDPERYRVVCEEAAQWCRDNGHEEDAF